MALTEQVVLDIQSAQRQIDALEAQLNQLGQPIDVPVQVGNANQLDAIRRDLELAEDSADGLNRELAQTDSELDQVGNQARRTGSELETAGRRGRTAFSGLTTSVVGLVGAFGAIQGARAFLSFAGDAIDAASDLEESTSKAGVVFGEFADDIIRFSEAGPQALGLANSQALEFTATFGNLFVALGLSQQAAAALSPEIVQLGSDLASFNNIEVDEVLTALRSGLVGEVEPLRRLGVSINAAAVEAKALELGLVGASGEVDEAAKVQARYALILEQTATAQGDFARTADGIANRQRTLAAEFENLRAALGEALLPAFETILEIIPSVVDALENTLVPAFAGLSASFESFDADGFISFIAGLPSGIQTAGSQFSSGAQAFGNAFDVLGSLAMLDFGDVGEQFRQLGEDIQDFRGAGAANEAIQTLILTLATGREPVAALESTLVDLGESVSSLTLDQFEPLALQLVAMAIAAGATAPELAALADTILQFGEDAGFSAEGVEILVAALRGPLATAQAEASSGDIIAANLAAIGTAAGDAAPEVEEFSSALAGFEAPDFSAEIDALEAQFDRLPDGLDAVGDALRNEENEIIGDFSTFLANLEDELAARQDFADNIASLRAAGFGDLADAFTEQGLEAAEALADAVANPEEAARAEAALDEFAEQQAQSFRSTISDVIQASPLDLTIPLNVVGVIQSLQLEGLPGQDAAQIVGGAGAGPNVGGGVTVNIEQNFDNTPSANTETQRAAQQAAAVVSALPQVN